MSENLEEEFDATEIIEQIQELCAILGWDIAVPDTEGVIGLVVGTPEFLETMIQDPESFDIFEKAVIAGEDEIH